MLSLAISSKAPALAPIFPLEIFDNIIALAEKSQLPTTLLVSRAFHQSSSYQRYRSVLLIGLVWDGQSEKIPIHGPLPKYIVERTLAVGFDKPATFLFDWLRAIPTLPSSPTFPNPFIYVTRLFLQGHRWDECEGVPPLDMPNVKTLQILMESRTSGGEIEICCHPGCNLLRNLRPQQVMIGNSVTTISGDARGLWTDVSRFPPEWVEDLVIFVGEFPFDGSLNQFSFLHWNLPLTLRKITFVFQPRSFWPGSPNVWVPSPRSRWYEPPPIAISERQQLWEDLAVASKGEVGLEVEIVGMELIEQEWLGVSVETGMEELREAMASLDVKRGIERSEAEKKAERVQFSDKSVWKERERTREFKRVVG